MEEKDRPGTGIGSEDHAEAPESRVYDIDAMSPASLDENRRGSGAAESPEAAEAEAPEEAPAGHGGRLKISRKQILDRFAEKNSAITKLQREKAALEKERQSFIADREAWLSEKTALDGQVKEFKDRWLRSVAEFENYRKRNVKEWELLKQQAKAEVILEVLNSLDDFERAFAVVEPAGETEFVKGIRLIYGNLLQILQKLGVTEIDALHQPFDPTRHMAIGQAESNDAPSGRIVQVVAKGYLLNGSVIRPAHVIVAK